MDIFTFFFHLGLSSFFLFFLIFSTFTDGIKINGLSFLKKIFARNHFISWILKVSTFLIIFLKLVFLIILWFLLLVLNFCYYITLFNLVWFFGLISFALIYLDLILFFLFYAVHFNFRKSRNDFILTDIHIQFLQIFNFIFNL